MTNTFKGLDLIDRVPEELWKNIVQEAMIKTIPKKKKYKTGKMVVWRGLPNSWANKRGKRQRNKDRYTHLNAEFQRRAKRKKKAFLSNQRQEIEENNKMGKIRDLFKKIRDTKGTFHVKMGTIKDRNGKNLSEADKIKKK